MPSSELTAELASRDTVSQIMVEASVANSGKQIKDALSRGALLVNGKSLTEQENMAPAAVFAPERAAFGRFFLVRLGKKRYHLFERAHR